MTEQAVQWRMLIINSSLVHLITIGCNSIPAFRCKNFLKSSLVFRSMQLCELNTYLPVKSKRQWQCKNCAQILIIILNYILLLRKSFRPIREQFIAIRAYKLFAFRVLRGKPYWEQECLNIETFRNGSFTVKDFTAILRFFKVLPEKNGELAIVNERGVYECWLLFNMIRSQTLRLPSWKVAFLASSVLNSKHSKNKNRGLGCCTGTCFGCENEPGGERYFCKFSR